MLVFFSLFSVGFCIPSTDCKIVEPSTGEELGPNLEGEIWIRGPQVMKGYLNNPEATAECIDADGFFHSGDIGYVDDEGYLYICDRRVDLIIAGGRNLFAAEVEAAIDGHPAVESSAVIGLPDDDLGQRVHAIVHASGGVSEEALASYLVQQLIHYKRPRSYEFVDRPLRDDSGKLRRFALRAERIEDSATGRKMSPSELGGFE